MKLLLTYLLIAICNACVWSMLAVLVGMPPERTPLCWLLVCALAFFLLMFVAGAAIDRKPYYLGEK